MTEEEIRPIAENYVEEYCHCPDGEYTDGSLVCAGIGTALIVSRQLEKQIVALEAKNIELSENWRADHDTLVFYDEKLEKENAELIHENARLVTVIDKSKSYGISPLNYLIIKNLDDQLTKATELIELFVQWNYGCCKIPDLKDIVKQAEQFLKENGGKK